MNEWMDEKRVLAKSSPTKPANGLEILELGFKKLTVNYGLTVAGATGTYGSRNENGAECLQHFMYVF